MTKHHHYYPNCGFVKLIIEDLTDRPYDDAQRNQVSFIVTEYGLLKITKKIPLTNCGTYIRKLIYDVSTMFNWRIHYSFSNISSAYNSHCFLRLDVGYTTNVTLLILRRMQNATQK